MSTSNHHRMNASPSGVAALSPKLYPFPFKQRDHVALPPSFDRQGCEGYIVPIAPSTILKEMDPLSATVSTFTLGGIAVKAASSVNQLHADYRGAEQDARHVKNQHELLQANLEKYKGFPADALSELGREALQELATSWPEHRATDTRKGRLRFAITARSKHMDAIHRLKDLESSATLTAELESVRILREIEKRSVEDRNMTAIVKSLVEDHNARMTAIEEKMLEFSATLSHHTQALQYLVHQYDTSRTPTRRSVSQTYPFEWLAHFLGLFARLTISSDGSNSKYSLAFRLPIFYTFAIMGFMRLSGKWPKLHTVMVRPRRIIQNDAAIVKACEAGDVFTIKELFTAGLAHPDDVTEENFTLLRYAIRSGHEEVVQLLLEQGAQTNLTFGEFETSPLDNAFYVGNATMIRRLLQKGADIEYINGRTWTALSYLWDPVRENLASTPEILHICHQAGFTEWNHGDKVGWTPIYRAAAYGDEHHIRIFLRFSNLNDQVNQKTMEAGWNPIQCAARYGNVSTFKALIEPVYHIELRQMLDNRGWTLLHLVAASGSFPLMKLLLASGFSPDRWSFPSDELMPPELVGKTLTPRMVAAHYGHIEAYDAAFGEIIGFAPGPRTRID
ncbi:hypothetical protein BP5796_00640 [Coleophoma crateriformis]|uniref:Uncharacterized protein n=1 Tax=Coleophoma crateriformis TaxID=565419 RepID=A0A3D8T8M7_9HELO|nr:hypothetical protein BP5796_00640 [Coleophoma crateriformis]